MLRARHTDYFLLMFFMFFVCIGGAIHAEDAAPKNDSKEAFIKAWEDNIKAMPTTVIFEKTAVKDVYNFETTLFPYKGKLKLLNVFIDTYMGYYYDYDDDTEYALKGVAEITLDQSSEELDKKYPQSYHALSKNMFLFFEPETKRWMNSNDFKTFKKEQEDKKPKETPTCTPTKMEKKEPLIGEYGALAIMVAFFLFIGFLAFKNSKNQNETNFDLKEAVVTEKKAVELMEESICLQKEQTEILRKILERNERS